MQVLYRVEAGHDLENARSWYEGQRPGLGSLFEASVQAIERVLTRHPSAFPEAHRDVRRALLPRFPYALYYRRIDEEMIEVVAVLHTSQQPINWQNE